MPAISLAQQIGTAGPGQQTAAQDDRPQVGLDSQPLAQRLRDNAGFDRPAAVAARRFRKRHAEPAQFGECGPVFRAPARLAVGQPGPDVEAVVPLDKAADAFL